MYCGGRIQLEYRMPKAFSHAELSLGLIDTKENKVRTIRNLAEVWSLGGSEATNWQKMSMTITTTQEVNALIFATWGASVDMESEMAIRELTIETAGTSDSFKWMNWPSVSKRISKSVPCRNPVQNIFPFGFWVDGGYIGHLQTAKKLKTYDEALEHALKDISNRGFNCVYFCNFPDPSTYLALISKLCAKYHLKYIPDFGTFNPKFADNPDWLKSTFISAMKYVKKYENDRNLLSWAFGEEYQPNQMDRLDLFHEMVNTFVPNKTVSVNHMMTETIRLSSLRQDVRVAMRDAYPFYCHPLAGPVSHEAQMNYMENELDNAWQVLPNGASLWYMAQAGSDYLPGTANDPQLYLMRPTPKTIRSQVWTGLAHGTTGFIFWLYAGSIAADPTKHSSGKVMAPQGILDDQWNPTDALFEASKLARSLIPFGSTLASLQRTQIELATDNRDLRAYLFSGKGNRAWVVVYNRSFEQSIGGKIRLPFTIIKPATDLVTNKKITVQIQDKRSSVFGVSISPAGGAVIDLGVLVPKLSSIPVWGENACVNGIPRPDLNLFKGANGKWSFRYSRDFQQQTQDWEADIAGTDMKLQNWNDPAKNDMNGLFGSSAVIQMGFPLSFTNIAAQIVVSNHADSKERTATLEYSMDGKNYLPLVTQIFGSGSRIEVMGQVKLKQAAFRIWLRVNISNPDPYIILKSLSCDISR
jgi:hypothetical protein